MRRAKCNSKMATEKAWHERASSWAFAKPCGAPAWFGVFAICESCDGGTPCCRGRMTFIGEALQLDPRSEGSAA